MNPLGAFFKDSPQLDRLRSSINETWIDFDARIARAGANALTEAWARAACRLLLSAEGCLAARKAEPGWAALSAAQREILSDPNDIDRLLYAAIVLRQELDKVGGWRAKAIADLVCDDKGHLQSSLKQEPRRVIEAIALRDDSFNTTYFKILLRRRSLTQLFLLLLVVITVTIVLSASGALPEPLADTSMLIAVVLFGALGASVSVAQGLLTLDLSSKIPAQQLGSFVVWMRPTIGAAAALLAFVLLHANTTLKIFVWDTTNTVLILVLAFVAGFSERFIVGAIEKIPFTSNERKK
jgi:hypothetical protein